MKSMNWNEYFMSMCYLAAMRSKDENTNVGAVIVGPNNEIRSTGYNSFPRNCDDTNPDRQIRPEKYYWFEHAERNAIYNAARVGTPLEGCIMYVPEIPCMDCARAIVQSGIVAVITHFTWMGADTARKNWDEHHKRTIELFEECGVQLFTYYGPVIVNVKCKLNKQEVDLTYIDSSVADRPKRDQEVINVLFDKRVILEYPIKDYECYECDKMQDCPFAFDSYNIEGDCLADK